MTHQPTRISATRLDGNRDLPSRHDWIRKHGTIRETLLVTSAASAGQPAAPLPFSNLARSSMNLSTGAGR